jgi:hypothetical protein
MAVCGGAGDARERTAPNAHGGDGKATPQALAIALRRDCRESIASAAARLAVT